MQSAVQETQTLNLFLKAGNVSNERQKACQITWVYTLINDKFRWSKTSKNHFDSYIQAFQSNEVSAIFKPSVKPEKKKRVQQIDYPFIGRGGIIRYVRIT